MIALNTGGLFALNGRNTLGDGSIGMQQCCPRN